MYEDIPVRLSLVRKSREKLGKPGILLRHILADITTILINCTVSPFIFLINHCMAIIKHQLHCLQWFGTGNIIFMASDFGCSNNVSQSVLHIEHSLM